MNARSAIETLRLTIACSCFGLLAGALVLAGFLSRPAMAALSTNVVMTTSGPVRGVADQQVQKFLGIRYAASPAGAHRWLPPEPPVRSTHVIDATKPGSPCPQVPSQFANPSTDEDCLFLNVTRPVLGNRHEGLPVLIWIHGGGLIQGAGAPYDPTIMVERGNIIVVSINYRLGALGWLAEEALSDANGNSGNYGLMDQQLAMKWVRDNIRAFGGDSKRVTISGESAGGLSTLSNLASPTAQGLFHQAIVESGAYSLFTVPSLVAQKAKGAAFASALGCTGTPAEIANCLRAAPVASVLAHQGIIGAAPTAGVPTLPVGLSEAFTTGTFNRVPVIQGSNHEEGRLFEPSYFDPAFKFAPHGPAQALITAGKQTYAQEVAFYVGKVPLLMPFSGATAALAALYPPENFSNPDDNNDPSADEALAQIFTDVIFSCNALAANNMLAKFVLVYAYEFNDPNAPDVFQPLIGFSYGASHASELQYLFDAATLQGPTDAAANALSPGATVQPPPLTPGGQQLASEMKTYWTNFVVSGTPNGRKDSKDAAFWPTFKPVTADLEALVPGPARVHPVVNFATDHKCAALAALGH